MNRWIDSNRESECSTTYRSQWQCFCRISADDGNSSDMQGTPEVQGPGSVPVSFLNSNNISNVLERVKDNNNVIWPHCTVLLMMLVKTPVLKYQWKKCYEETQTLCIGCSNLRRSQKIFPATDPLPRDMGRPKFNQLEMVTTFTYKPRLVRIDACNFKLLW